jgi:hypothetical protein
MHIIFIIIKSEALIVDWIGWFLKKIITPTSFLKSAENAASCTQTLDLFKMKTHHYNFLFVHSSSFYFIVFVRDNKDMVFFEGQTIFYSKKKDMVFRYRKYFLKIVHKLYKYLLWLYTSKYFLIRRHSFLDAFNCIK